MTPSLKHIAAITIPYGDLDMENRSLSSAWNRGRHTACGLLSQRLESRSCTCTLAHEPRIRSADTSNPVLE